ncbi:chemotaxis protein methyltransferase CheR [Rhizomicrobium palustre]|uniref:Chemotaxis protein methyltransferase n=1 Tax=Rhizomicrobium palustre TaxID=189966 RepID=A0A846N047_9PROT|nr:protein-glutamate O-methyltransferase [Rhizomicrobium palustre]NIK89238.1 chemotaxis protein methyltransferase CheR [Rhizomicrobium palustre]
MATGTNPRDLAVPDGEFPFTWQDFRQIAELVHSEAGIVLTEAKVNLVYSRLAKRLRTIGLRSFRDYCSLIQGTDGVDERQAMIAAMTTNVTRFFRESHHFDYLRNEVLPDLLENARRGGKVRIWSAGCSSGEEAYSIALTMLGLDPQVAQRDVLILASDIDPEMLKRGSRGIYPVSQLGDVPQELRRKWMKIAPGSGGSELEVGDEMHEMVRFRELNLLREWPMKGPFDIIFCRNVMIYFDDETQNTVWKRFAGLLRPGGTLCIGHSERIVLGNHPYDLVGQTIYRKHGAK